jgi:glycosyltransferase involved in cell wall biosynthesis
MKVLFINIDGLKKFGSDYFTVDPWILFPLRLADHCEQVTLLAALQDGQETTPPPSLNGWKVENKPNLKIEQFDYYNSFVTYYKLWPKKVFTWKKQMESLIAKHDVVIIKLPSPVTPLVTRCIKKLRKSLVTIVRGNIEFASDRLVENKGLKKVFFQALIRLITEQEKRCSLNSKLVYVYSGELMKRFQKSNSNIKPMSTPHLSVNDFHIREDTCQSKEIRLLRICRIVPIKGIECLFEALVLLRNKDYKIRLEIVGQPNVPEYLTKLEQLVKTLGITEQVVFAGWVPYDQTQKFYIQNDIQIISSINEGLPRSIVEGASRGLPLVSTRAGGCEDFLTHEKNALLVPSENPVELASAIERLINEKNLRKKLIKDGYELARSGSFEVMGKQFLNDIRQVAGAS